MKSPKGLQIKKGATDKNSNKNANEKDKKITALVSCDIKAVTYMIRGKMMSFFTSVYRTDLQIYSITRRQKSKGKKSIIFYK